MSEGSGSRYPIAAVRERVRQHGRPALDFVVGRHREPPPRALEELLANHQRRLLLTPSSADELTAFGEAAAGMLERVYGVRVGSASILPVPGGRTAMSFLASCLIGPDDEVVVVDPAYPAFARVARQLRASVHTVSLDPDRAFDPDLSTLGVKATRRVRFAALNFPNNPTGAVIREGALAELVSRLTPGAVVFNDATYGPLTYLRSPWSLLASEGPRAAGVRLLELHCLAKMFSLGPLSVSFLVGDEAIIGELREYSEYAWSDQSSFQVQVALQCLADGDHLQTMRRVFRQRLERLHETLQSLGFSPCTASSGMYLVCRVPAAIGGREVTGAGNAAEVLLADHGVAVVPWEVSPHEYLRFSLQYHEDDLAGLAALGRHGALASGVASGGARPAR